MRRDRTPHERASALTPAECESMHEALAIFDKAVPLAGTPGEIHLIRQVGRPIEDLPPDIRFCPKFDLDEPVPALISLLRDIESNEPRATYCQLLGRRVGISYYRGPTRGCVLKLSLDGDMIFRAISVAEDFEHGLSLWACGSSVWITLGLGGTQHLSEGIRTTQIDPRRGLIRLRAPAPGRARTR